MVDFFINYAAKIGKFGDSAKEISNFFTIRHKKALHIGVQGFCLNGY